MKYLLDTCAVSDFIKGETGTLENIKKISPSDIAISTITVMEMHYGLALNPLRAQKIRNMIHDFLESINILEFNENDAKEAAILRALLRQQGSTIGSYGILLAGAACNRKLTLVSANTKEFERIESLSLINWRQ